MSPQLQWAIDQITFARKYTLQLLETIEPADWFRIPVGGVSHVAWQVGHLAMGEPDPAKNPDIEEIRHTFEAVHRQALHELPELNEEELTQPPLKPHRVFTTKLGSLIWCGQHELIHAGQIGLIRRQLGQKPLW
jgi:uncharacterized damage-inducible protein DinB